jgi:hypothetical protein
MAEPKTHRVVYALYFYLPNRMALVVQLNRQGMPENHRENGRPRAPKRRTVDLRPGDFILCQGEWQRIEAVEVFRDHRLSESEALAHRGEWGYLYRNSVGS